MPRGVMIRVQQCEQTISPNLLSVTMQWLIRYRPASQGPAPQGPASDFCLLSSFFLLVDVYLSSIDDKAYSARLIERPGYGQISPQAPGGGRPNGPAARRSLRDFRDWRGDEITDSAYPSLAPHPAITAEDQTIYGSGNCYKVFSCFSRRKLV